MEYELKKIDLSPEDILVIKFDVDQISEMKEMHNIAEAFRDFLPDNRIICIPTYIDLMSIHSEGELNNLEEIKW